MPGAGRKPGSLTKKNREIADKAAEQGITPLEVMLDNMRTFYDLAVLTRQQLPNGLIPLDDPLLIQHLKYRALAHESAKDAAPYMQAKLASIAVSGNVGLTWEQALDQVAGGDKPDA